MTSRKRLTTEEWALSHDISIEPTPPVVENSEQYPLTARQVAIRAVILQGVVAVASDVDPTPVIEWFRDQSIWVAVSPSEQAFLLDPSSRSADEKSKLRWRKEAEWTLLWILGKVEKLGLPTRQCNTRGVVDEIIPMLGSNIESFLSSADLRPAGVLLSEVDRHYNLWCGYIQDRRNGAHLIPSDLLIDVLYQREYAFEWLHGFDAWDEVQCDA